MLKNLTKAPKYLKEFGVIGGIRLFTQIELHKKSGKDSILRTIKTPGYTSPIVLRDTIADHSIFWQCMVKDQYDFRIFTQAKYIYDEYRSAIARGQTPLIIDCGGNIGLSTIWLAKIFPAAKIIVLEPDDGNFEVLRANTAHLSDRVSLLKGGIWNKPGKIRIINPGAGSAAFRVEEVSIDSDNGIRAYTIDEVCEISGTDEVLYVKLDIEGAQARLFSSNTQWIARTKLISLELDDWLFPWGGTSQSFFRALGKYAFDYLIRDESIFCFKHPDVGQAPSG